MNSGKGSPADCLDTNSTLLWGDCLDRLGEIEDGSVDCVVTSPPYNIDKEYLSGGDSRPDYLEWLEQVFSHVRRVSSCLWINVGYRKLPEGNIPIAFQIWDRVGMYLMQSLKWEYGSGMTYSSRFNHRSEDWLWFVKDSANYTFNPDAVRDPSLTKYANDKRNNPDGKLPGDIWYYPHVAGTFVDRCDHPAQYPVPMVERIILACTNPGDVVLDPFCGSGSTGVAAVNNGRRFIGIEQDPDYFAMARQRIDESSRPLVVGRPLMGRRPRTVRQESNAPTLFD